VNPPISVIIPSYNAEKTILETIESVLKQTYTNFELILINDGSTDQTLELLNKIKDERLKIFSFENSGLPTSRNRGIDLSSGEFITFIDADDLWTPDKLDKQFEALKNHPDAGVAYSWTVSIDESGNLLNIMEAHHFEGDIYPQLLVRCFIASGSNVMIRRECINSVGLFDPDLESAADWDYWIRLSIKWPFVLVPRYQVLYRTWSGGMSNKVESIEKNILKVIEKTFSETPDEFRPLKRKSLSFANQYFAYLYLTHKPGNNWNKLVLQKLKASISLYPWILLNRNTLSNLLSLILLYLLPARISHGVIKLMQRTKWKLKILVTPELHADAIISRMR